MIYKINKGLVWFDNNSQIIFNPVSVSDNKIGDKVFNKILRENYRNVYDEYKDYIIDIPKNKLLGDIQLIQIDKSRTVMNGYVYKNDQLDLYCLTKTLVELYNLGTEYKLNIALSLSMYNISTEELKIINTIIETIFTDFDYYLYLYK